MYHDILVPLDGSPFAEAALPLAACLARSAHARLHLTLVHEPTAALVGMGGVPLPTTDLDEALTGRETAYLAGIAARWHKSAGSPVEYRLVQGRAGPDACEEAARLVANLVVMTTHGRGTLQRLWLGSVADYLVRHVTIPVLLIPRRARSDSTNPPTIRHILVALDLSEASEAILSPVKSLAALTDADLTLIYVAGTHDGLSGFEMAGPMEQVFPAELLVDYAERRLYQLAAMLRTRNRWVTTRVVVAGNTAEGLLRVLDEDEYDLIALTTHGAGGLRRALLGSVADKVVRGATKPVLVLRPPVSAVAAGQVPGRQTPNG